MFHVQVTWLIVTCVITHIDKAGTYDLFGKPFRQNINSVAASRAYFVALKMDKKNLQHLTTRRPSPSFIASSIQSGVDSP
jgi:hypothetical protein